MIFGLLAALGWGTSDLVAAISSRKVGSRATVVVAQLAGLGGFVVLNLVTTPEWEIPWYHVLLLLGSGLFAGVAYFALYRGLEVGPVALVSPVAAAFGAVTVLLAVVLLDEDLRGALLLGVLLTLVGVVLVSTDLRRVGAEAFRHRRGVLLGLAAMTGFGVAAFVSGSLAKDYGWLPPITVSRVSSLVLILAIVSIRPRERDEGRVGISRAGVVLASLVGIADVFGIAAYARGSQLGLVSIVAAVSATFTLIPVAGGIALFGERPAPNQLFGVVLVVGGLAALGWGS